MTNHDKCLPCDGIQVVTPLPIFNRPGLESLKYRIGSHGTFFESLLARISTLTAEELGDLLRTVNEQNHRRLTGQSKRDSQVDHPLRDWLTTRETTDPSIAFLDAWSTLADVLTFYQERIANEGYLRTAQERRSIEKLAGLTGYRLRPGVSSMVHLAFEVDDTAIQVPFGNNSPVSSAATPFLIPKGTACKSTPAPGSNQEPQTYESSEDLWASKELNELRPRLTRPQEITRDTVHKLTKLYFQGLGLRLKASDYLAIVCDRQSQPVLHQIVSVSDDNENQRTVAFLRSNPLSEDKLIEDIQNLINNFPSLAAAMPTHELLPIPIPSTAAEFRNKVQTELARILREAAAPPQPKVTLQELDSGFSSLICLQLQIGTSTLRSLTVTQRTNAQTILSNVTAALDTFKTSVVTPYHDVVVHLLDRLKFEDDNLVPLIDGPANMADVNSIVAVKSALRQLAIPNLNDPPLGALPFSVALAVGDPLAIVPPSLPEPPTSTSAAVILFSGKPSDLTLKLDLTGITGYDNLKSPIAERNEWTLLRNSDASPTPLEVVLSKITIESFAGTGRRYCSITIPGRAPALFAFKAGTTSTDFQINELERVTYCKLTETQPIDDQFLFTGSNAKYAMRISIVRNFDNGASKDLIEFTDTSVFQKRTPLADGVLVLELVDASMDTTAVEVSKAVRTVTFRPGSSDNKSCRNLLLEIFHAQDLSEPPVALAIRDVIAYSAEASPGCTTTDFQPTGALVKGLVGLYSDLIRSGQDRAGRESALADFKADFAPQNYWDVNNTASSRSILYSAASSTLNTLKVAPSESPSDFEALIARATRDIPHPRIGAHSWQLRLASLGKRRTDEESATLTKLMSWKAVVDDSLRFQSSPSAADAQFNVFFTRAKAKYAQMTGTSLSIAANRAKTATEVLRLGVLALLNRFQWLDDRARDLGNELIDALNSRRVSFLDLLVGAIDANSNGISDSSPSTAIKEASSLVIKLRTRLTEASERLSASVAASSDDRARNLCNDCFDGLSSVCSKDSHDPSPAVRCIADILRSELRSTGNTVPPLTIADALLKLKASTDLKTTIKSLEAMIDALDTLVFQVDPPQSTETSGSTQDVTRSVEHILSAITQIGSSDQTTRSSILLDLARVFAAQSDVVLGIAKSLDPAQREFLYDLMRQARISDPSLQPHVYVFRSKANAFGWNASGSVVGGDVMFAKLTNELHLTDADKVTARKNVDGVVVRTARPDLVRSPEEDRERRSRIFVDGELSGTSAGSFIAIARPPRQSSTSPTSSASITDVLLSLYVVTTTSSRPRSAYELKNTTTVLDLDSGWWNPTSDQDPSSQSATEGFEVLQSTRIYCDSEELILAEEPIAVSVVRVTELELNSFVEGLAINKPISIRGVPQIVSTAAETNQTEVMQIVDIRHGINDRIFGDAFRTTVRFNQPLKFSYLRSSLKINANVVEASHGETQQEVLGSGDGAKEFQKFSLKRSDVSQLVAPNERGIQSTLLVKVNNVEWTEQESLRDSKAVAEEFVTRSNSDQQMTVLFGDGVNGVRIPTGIENVRTEYRTGLGRKGNVASGQINQLLGAPLGVKKVNNPLAAKGGSDPETRDLARENVPLAVTAMDRLVSVQDYEDFARTYAGIGKATSALLQGAIHVTIVGLDPDPLERDNPLYLNLQQALQIFGDPSQQFELLMREASLLIIIAKIKLKPRYEWNKVQPNIRAALLSRFQYEIRDLGQDVLLSDAIGAAQKVDGVLYVDVDKFDAIKQDEVSSLASRLNDDTLSKRARVKSDLARSTTDADELAYLPPTTAQRIIAERRAAAGTNGYDPNVARIRAAQICYLTPDIPDTLILEQIQ